jgi:amino acid transporter
VCWCGIHGPGCCCVMLCAVFFLILFLGKVLYKRFIKRQKKKLLSSLPTLISTIITMMYFLYLLLVRNTFDVFNCNAPVPPDPRGTLYMEAAVVPCYEKGGLHMQMFPFAIVCLVVYVIGFPLFAGYIVYTHREACKEDQLLRALGFGDTRKTNPNCYEIRLVVLLVVHSGGRARLTSPCVL